MKVIASSLRKGNVVDIDGRLYVVLQAENIHPGKGTPVTQIDMRRISDGVKVSERYRTTEQVERAFVEDREHTFLYQDAEESHVEANRALYRQKFDAAERIFGSRFEFYRPPGGFFLWLKVGDGERAAETLWREAAIKVVPGEYIGKADATGRNPGAGYIRVALVHDTATVEAALTRFARVLA